MPVRTSEKASVPQSTCIFKRLPSVRGESQGTALGHSCVTTQLLFLSFTFLFLVRQNMYLQEVLQKTETWESETGSNNSQRITMTLRENDGDIHLGGKNML